MDKRQKLEEILGISRYGNDAFQRYKAGFSIPDDWLNFQADIDQIDALYDMEEANHKQIRIKRKELFPHGHKDCFHCENFVTELAKTQEREGIGGILYKMIVDSGGETDLTLEGEKRKLVFISNKLRPIINTLRAGQALKGEGHDNREKKDD